MSKVLKYRAYEEEVYNWLMAKHKSNPEFTFSLRQKGSKGAELDYFIGTSKSNYFGTTLWSCPVGFPGSSGDLIDIIFVNASDKSNSPDEFITFLIEDNGTVHKCKTSHSRFFIIG